MDKEVVPRSISPGRVLGVTGGLFLMGAVTGGLTAFTLAFGLLVVADGARAALHSWDISGVAAISGAAFGAILGPIVAWTLLRRVPIGRAVVECAVGGGLLSIPGLFLGELSILGVLLGGTIGVLLAAVRMRYRYP